jgi:hypothetical protein
MKLLNNSENLFIKLLHWPYIGNLDPENAYRMLSVVLKICFGNQLYDQKNKNKNIPMSVKKKQRQKI